MRRQKMARFQDLVAEHHRNITIRATEAVTKAEGAEAARQKRLNDANEVMRIANFVGKSLHNRLPRNLFDLRSPTQAKPHKPFPRLSYDTLSLLPQDPAELAIFGGWDVASQKKYIHDGDSMSGPKNLHQIQGIMLSSLGTLHQYKTHYEGGDLASRPPQLPLDTQVQINGASALLDVVDELHEATRAEGYLLSRLAYLAARGNINVQKI